MTSSNSCDALLEQRLVRDHEDRRRGALARPEVEPDVALLVGLDREPDRALLVDHDHPARRGPSVRRSWMRTAPVTSAFSAAYPSIVLAVAAEHLVDRAVGPHDAVRRARSRACVVAPTVARSCDTSSSVVPLWITWRIRSRHFCWNVASPTASTSSTMRMLGSRNAAIAKPSRTFMPLE